MSITYGFFNSLNGDRRYNTDQISKIITSLITDGVFQSAGSALAVAEESGLNITVAEGYAFFNEKWLLNDALLPITCDPAELILDRIDAVVLEVNTGIAVRACDIKIVNGIPSSTPVNPILTSTEFIHQYPLAYIYRTANSTAVYQSNITNCVGTSACPFVTGILETMDVDMLLAQWNAEYQAWFANAVSETEDIQDSLALDFNTWFDLMKGQLTTDAAGNLQTQINTLNARFLTANKILYVATTGSDITGDGTSALPYATITKALSMIPKNLNGFDATINIASGTYAESLLLFGYHGGSINIILSGDISVNRIEVQETTCVSISNASLYTITTNTTTQHPINIARDSLFRLYNTNLILPTSATYSGIYTTLGSNFDLMNGTATILNAGNGIRCSDSSSIFVNVLTGSGNVVGILGEHGSKISYGTKTISATTDKVLTGGAIITNELKGTSTLTVIGDVNMVGKTVTLTKGATVLSAVMPAGLSVSFDIPELGDWVLYNPSTAVNKTLAINYYGIYKETLHSYKVYTIKIDGANSNPDSAVTYADDAIGMTPGSQVFDDFFGYKPCLFVNGVRGVYLNPNNYALDVNGNAVAITVLGNDVMIEFPKRGYKISKSGSITTVSITDEPNKAGYVYYPFSRSAHGDRDYFYIGAYIGACTASKMYSVSDANPYPTSVSTLANLRSYAIARGANYSMIGFYQWIYLQTLYLIKYKGLNCQTALGYGYVGGTAMQNTGGGNTLGLNYGSKVNQTTRLKCFGLEDLWGNASTLLDGALIDSSLILKTSFIPSQFNDAGTNYNSQGVGASVTLGFMTSPIGTNEKGYLPAAAGGSSSTYFGDTSAYNASTIFGCGGGGAEALNAGLFYNYPYTLTSAYLCSRLMFV